MNLGVDARPLAYGITGNSRYLAEVLRILVPQYKNVSFYLFSNKPIHPVFLDILNHENVFLCVESIPIPGPLYLNLILPFALRKKNIHVFWATLQMLPIWKLPIRTVVNYHDLNFVQAKETMSRANYLQHKLLSPITMRNADRILCLSQMTKDGISAFHSGYTEKCEVVYPGVSRIAFQKKEGAFLTPFFLAVGTLEPRKNIGFLVQAFLQYRQLHPESNYSLVVLGRKGWGKEGMELWETFQSEELKGKKVFFYENPADSLLSQAYQECSAFFFPSLHEGFGLPLLEATLEGKVCMASEIQVFREILDPKEDIFGDPRKLEDWVQGFAKLSDPERQIRKKPFPEKEWSWAVTSQKIARNLCLPD